jgi:hypothetical protein
MAAITSLTMRHAAIKIDYNYKNSPFITNLLEKYCFSMLFKVKKQVIMVIELNKVHLMTNSVRLSSEVTTDISSSTTKLS